MPLCPMALGPTSLVGGLRHCSASCGPCEPRATNINTSLVGPPMQLGPHVPKARTHVSKTLDVRAIMGL
jgi:hypothetical protein